MQALILAGFSHWQVGQSCDCGAAAATFRCVECFNAPMWCHTCVVTQHRFIPFHRIERWDGQKFVQDALKDDRVLYLHLGQDRQGRSVQRCPHIPPGPAQLRELTICDSNGFHTRFVEFCCCTRTDGGHWEQLLSARLFPATIHQPQTAFTFGVMKQFQVHSLSSKKSAYDYVKALCQLTSHTEPEAIANRYREFLLACRIWRALALQRRTGQAHGFDAYVPNRRARSLVLRCPACPEVGFNMTSAQMEAAEENEKHKFTLFISTDGNFKLQRKNKRDDPDDIALNGGHGYFIPAEDYKQYFKDIKPSSDAGTCSHLKAARMQNIAKFKNAVITGVVAVQCARHGFYLPQAIVDLLKGEGFAFTDAALRSGLGMEAKHLRWIRLAYDIWCQYQVNLLERIKDHWPEMLPIFNKIDGAIGKMHILNHQERCIFAFNLNFLFHVGLTTGELIETGWAEHNLTAGSTREMNDGHRHDVIDGTCDHWNWQKTVRLGA
ncbi:hypothetical protein GGX14DRAFT_344027 [Mycena pura]|uniref:CxC2-like cysteine cluster KDZ transposase-associated domain-containing protein n=1 Tax=Mycena pura TaxID=153505 RepID=A0AAD7E655_9AGAR|nr:hypothetical protein GGX14DRAFT_344027 [Mycena pura]